MGFAGVDVQAGLDGDGVAEHAHGGGGDLIGGGRGMGEPLRLMIELEEKAEIINVLAHQPGAKLLMASKAGYGFIAPESGGKDVFVHISAVERSGLTGLADNQKVTYDLEAGRDGREAAVNISLA